MAKIWNRCWSDTGIPIFSGCRSKSSQDSIEETLKVRISKSQKEFLQTTRAIGHEKNKWSIESVGNEQREQDVSIVELWIEEEMRIFVGIMPQIIFQRNNRKRWCNFSFQRLFHLEAFNEEVKAAREVVLWWCIDLVENFPEDEGVHRIESFVEFSLIFNISDTESLNHSC